MVVNIGKVLSEDWFFVRQDIQAVVQVTHQAGALVKVIFENCYLQDNHKIRLCEICAEAGADFVKTSTGYASGGATIEDLRLMRRHSPPHLQVKAAGGVRTLDALLEVRSIGVSRVGATRRPRSWTSASDVWDSLGVRRAPLLHFRTSRRGRLRPQFTRYHGPIGVEAAPAVAGWHHRPRGDPVTGRGLLQYVLVTTLDPQRQVRLDQVGAGRPRLPARWEDPAP